MAPVLLVTPLCLLRTDSFILPMLVGVVLVCLAARLMVPLVARALLPEDTLLPCCPIVVL